MTDLATYRLKFEEANRAEKQDGVNIVNGKVQGHVWSISKQEKRILSKVLGMKMEDIAWGGILMNQSRPSCSSCGKPAGIVDLTNEALMSGAHSVEFVKENFKKVEAGTGNVTVRFCSQCSMPYSSLIGCAYSFHYCL